jgi:hypothetical protein
VPGKARIRGSRRGKTGWDDFTGKKRSRSAVGITIFKACVNCCSIKECDIAGI